MSHRLDQRRLRGAWRPARLGAAGLARACASAGWCASWQPPRRSPLEQLDQHLGDADVGPRGQLALLDAPCSACVSRSPGRTGIIQRTSSTPGEPSEATRLSRPSHTMRIIIAQVWKPDAHRPPTIDGLGRLLVEVDGLGIVGAGEGDDLVLRHRLGAHHVRLADLEVLVMQQVPARNVVLHPELSSMTAAADPLTRSWAPCQRRG